MTTITLNLAERSATTNHVDSAFRARPNAEYLGSVRAPLTRLRRALQTGSFKTEQEKAREREVWNRDMELIRSLSAKESRSALFQAGDIEKDDPETYLKMVEAHCEMLLEMGQRMEHVEQLQVGYWIDRLTVTLVRLKRWEEAERRIDAFFALPDRYRGRSSPSDLESLSKRLQRCRKMLAR